MIRFKESLMRALFMLAACASILCVALIAWFIFSGGFTAISQIGLWNFLSGEKWKPGQDLYGILPMILGSAYVTGGAILTGVPVGILAALCLARFCPKKAADFIRPLVSLMAGVPSVVYGFFALTVLVPVIGELTSSDGMNMLTASLLLGVMILPTVVTVSESALRAVPESYYEGSRALGVSHEKSVFKAVLPAAKSGVTAGVVLGLGRAVGETMAVIMVAGNQARMPKGILKGVRTLTVNIAMEMGYASGLHREALIATGLVLFVFILLINGCFAALKRRRV